jgi:hypothetical protein
MIFDRGWWQRKIAAVSADIAPVELGSARIEIER